MRTYLDINKTALRHNYLRIKNKRGKLLLAVVKSNAYGLGLKEVSRELYSMNCSAFVVNSFEEALIIRKCLIPTPIILLEHLADIRKLINFKITSSVTNLEQLKLLASYNAPLMIQLFFDCGLRREGFSLLEVDEVNDILKKSKLHLTGLLTHHSGPAEYENETARFKKFCSSFSGNLLIHHQASNSMFKEDKLSNAVRVGGALYGLRDEKDYDLKPTLSLYSTIIEKKRVQKGEKVGYEGSPLIKEDGYIYTIPFGYADGWGKERNIVAWIEREILVQASKTMMNHRLLFSKKSFEVGSVIELLGPHLDIFNLAKLYKTIPYELSSSLSPNLRRNITN